MSDQRQGGTDEPMEPAPPVAATPDPETPAPAAPAEARPAAPMGFYVPPAGPAAATASPGAFGTPSPAQTGYGQPASAQPAYGQQGYAPPAVVASTAAPTVAPGWYPTPDGGTAWWDGYQWAAVPPPRLESFYSPVETLGAATQVLLVGCAVAGVFVFGAQMQRYRLVGRVMDSPGSVTFSQLSGSDGLVAASALLRLVVLIPAGIVFLVWLHRVFSNLEVPLRSGTLDHSPGWAVGWWFVPFANLVKPKQVMNEAWKASEPGSTDPNGQALHSPHRKAPAILSWWWAAWLLSGFTVWFGVTISAGSGSPGQLASTSLSSLHASAAWSAVGSVFYVAAAVMAMMIVRDITSRQGRRAANMGARVLP